jgi:hypothetical protein
MITAGNRSIDGATWYLRGGRAPLRVGP